MPVTASIMVITADDDAMRCLDAACRALSLPYELDRQETGEFGLLELNVARRHGRLPELVIIDSDLPGLLGCDVVNLIRQDPRLRAVATMMMLPQGSVMLTAAQRSSDRCVARPTQQSAWVEMACSLTDALTWRHARSAMPRRPSQRIPHLLHIDDDAHGRFDFSEAFVQSGLPGVLHSLAGAHEAFTYLTRLGPYVDAPRPKLVIVAMTALNDGRLDLLQAIKTNALYRSIPVIVLTSADVRHGAHLTPVHADECITRPASMHGLIELISSFDHWISGSYIGSRILV